MLKTLEMFLVVVEVLRTISDLMHDGICGLQVSAGELERLMVRLPSMFRQELSGVGATLEKRWKFCGFDSLGSA